MTKPVLILDAYWRTMDELFSSSAKERLLKQYSVVWGKDEPIPDDVYNDALPKAEILIAETPKVDQHTLTQAPNLKCIVEVSGAFPDTIDYGACANAGIEVLSCAPGFRQSVAEMGLAFALSGARGVMTEHENFRAGTEHWLSDNAETDFTIYGAPIGFLGFGQIAQEITRLLKPFSPTIAAFDPWLPAPVADDYGVELMALDDVLVRSRCVFVTAVPTAENYHLLNEEKLAMLQKNALLIVLSRAHLVDFDALELLLKSGHIRAAIDVFPSEPVASNQAIRKMDNVILSPHRAAAVQGGRQLIGDMILSDLAALFAGQSVRRLGVADLSRMSLLAGVGDADSVGEMASSRS